MKRGVGFAIFMLISIGAYVAFYKKNTSIASCDDRCATAYSDLSTSKRSRLKQTLPSLGDTNRTHRQTQAIKRHVLPDNLDGIDLNSLIEKETKPHDWLKRMTEQYHETYDAPRQRYLNVALHKRMKQLGVTYGDRVFLRIFKKESLLEVWIEQEGSYRHLKDYAICAWSGHLGPKLKEGDKQAPEGFYRVYRRQLNPNSRYHLAFNLGYPNAYDRAYGRTGSFLMVHGGCRSVGCYAMTDRNIEEIYRLVEAALHKGQPYVPVHIFPFRLTDTALADYSGAPWFDFWMNLKEGYDYFENTHQVPKIRVKHKRYVVYE